MADAKVTWYLEKVKVKIDAATDEALAQVAFQIEAATKKNIINVNKQLDTGFMGASVYAKSKAKGSEYAEARAEAETKTLSSKTGRVVDVSKRMAREETLPKSAGAAVVVGANYAIYQEAQQSFLYAAAVEVAATVKGTVEPVYRSKVND